MLRTIDKLAGRHLKRVIDHLTDIYDAQSRQLDLAYHKEEDPVSWRKHPLSPHTTQFLSLIYANMPPANGEVKRPKIIDLGCGAGEKTDRLRSFSLDVVGVDNIDHALKAARKLAKKKIIDSSMKIVKADITDLPFEAETFDGAHDYLSFLHIIKEDWPKYVNSVRRVLKKGAPLLVVTFTASDKDYYGYPISQMEDRGIVFTDEKYQGDRERVAHLINSYFYFPTEKELRNAFSKHFKVIKMEEFHHPLHQESEDHKERKLWHILMVKK